MSYSMICERHPDWLGSNRLTSSPSRTALSSIAYGPFGETYAPFGTSDPSFTGQNQDTSGGLYDFLFREYSTQGRWPSPDPAGLAAVDFSDPRSLNRYAYVLNDPLDSVDPYGLCRLRMVSYESGWALEWHGMCWAGNLPHPPCSGFFSVFAWWCGQPPHIPTGIRKKGETFSQCMVRNEKNFSVGGVFDAVLKTNIGKNDLVQIAAGNAFGGAYSAIWGNSASSAVSTAVSESPGIINSGMGSTLTVNRSTTNIAVLNIAGNGGVPKALGSASLRVKSILGTVEKGLKLGIKGNGKLIIDAALFAAQVAACAEEEEN